MSEQIPWDEFAQIMKELRFERRDRRLARTAKLLKAQDVCVIERFSHEHMRVEVDGTLFDFWPSTGRWRQHPLHNAKTRTGGIPAMRKVAKESHV